MAIKQLSRDNFGIRQARFVLSGVVFPIAVGGIETVINPEPDVFYRVHTFLESGDLTVTQGGDVEYLLVGGGGAGLNGGGGGGFFEKFVLGEAGNTGGSLSINGGVHFVTVGLGGVNNLSGNTSNRTAQSGGISNFLSVTAAGGFGAANTFATIREGGDGGSGGGASGSTDDPIGDGGTNGGNGGAGARGDGGSGQGTPTETAISGSLVRYSGGGGAGLTTNIGVLPGSGGLGGGGDGAANDDVAQSGAPNTGGGGGGAGRTTNAEKAGNGGSGIVIVRYRISRADFIASGGVIE